ncbi:hypothetical protein [Brevibacillus laterosporus]|uniref:hypothetical protein n=1 Tax=Brevibacillus laterosporus TaxID=1465 RepID=UPI002656361F|nr:hypothetical protein [Brevibacillus laterosporus]MDN9012392.1 hypothetical protein [Brevibacillus laterosporus]MDO0943545.1 hypothetical protein [Brevibacillus laterosporus]
MFTKLPFGMNLQYFAKAGFLPEEEPIKDALKDDPLMQQILDASSAIALLSIKKNLANTPLTEVDRRIYYEAIDARARAEFSTWSIEEAAKEESGEKQKPSIGFTDSVEPLFTVLEDSAEDQRELCFSRAVPIMDDAGKSSGWYRQPVSKVDAINGNNRLYPKAVYQAALDSLKSTNFPYAGEHPHPRCYKGTDGRVLFDSSVPNQAVVFRDASIDASGIVWAEYKPLATDMGKQVQAMLDDGLPIGFSNRMTGDIITAKVEGKNVGVAKRLSLYTWDVVLNPAEPEAFTKPIELTDSAVAIILDSLSKEDDKMKKNFLSMSLDELRTWKKQNPGHIDMAVCDAAIEAKEKEQTLTDELEKLRLEKQTREQQEEANRKKDEAQKALVDAVNELPYDKQVKDGLLQKGAAITDASEVASFIDTEKAFVDAIQIDNQKQSLGIPSGRAAIVNQEVQIGNSAQPWVPVVDKLMTAFDDQFRAKDRNFRVDENLRKGNLAILDRILGKMERENHHEYQTFMHSLTDAAQDITDGVIQDSAATSTGDLAQIPVVSLAFMRQMFQDLKFAQLTMAESFSGTTYKIPVEFQTEDLYSQDDFGGIGEFDGIPTEGVETFLLEFGADWLKRATKISKEAQVELQSGPFNYDAVARNLASINARMSRNIDQRISTEMISVSDEHLAIVVKDETVSDPEFHAAVKGSNVPFSSNATFVVDLLCGQQSGKLADFRSPIVRPRTKVWLDVQGKKQSSKINDVVVTVGGKTLVRGQWDHIKGMVVNGEYAIDFENAKVYFTSDSGVSDTKKPMVKSYSYATNVSYFDLTVPAGVDPAKYYNRLIELVTDQKAYMGSAPRYVTPDFLLGSLNAMSPIKKAELFYRYASPNGTNLLQGDMYFATRENIQLGEHNAPWVAGDSRLLLGKTNATRMGIGSPLEMEGPFPYMNPETNQITSAKLYYATQQIAINTPLVIDKSGMAYHPPYRTIKLFNSKQG